MSLKTAAKETKKSPVILELCLRKTQAEKSHDYRIVIVFENFLFQNVFRSYSNKKPGFSNSSSLNNLLEKLRFRDSLAWKVKA